MQQQIVAPALHDAPVAPRDQHVLILRRDVDRGDQAPHAIRAANSHDDSIPTGPRHRRDVVHVERDLRHGGTLVLRQRLQRPKQSEIELEIAFLKSRMGVAAVGGLALVGNLVSFRHSLPLENLNINELEAPLALVTTTADHLERALTGGDRF